MKKAIFYSAFLLFLSLTIPVLAQEAAVDAPAVPVEAAPVVEAVPAPVPEPEPAAVAAPTPVPVVAPSVSIPSEPLITKALREGLPLRVRQEQAFDANGNNRLEPNEIKAFLKSVYEDTSKGSIKNTSDILYQFDTNKDGFIDRGEASGFSRYSI